VKLRYQPRYCEENIWWLAQEPAFARRPAFVVFISNALGCCPMWQQRAAAPGDFVPWDYHVVLLVAGARRAEVWDLDSRLTPPVELARYLSESFRPLPARFAPRFRVIPAQRFVATFVTDRRHMRAKSGRWLAPPPAWPPPGGGASNLAQFTDMTQPTPGVVLDAHGLVRRFGAAGQPST
jgi:hypothetical protein